jgi:hypothetical protein
MKAESTHRHLGVNRLRVPFVWTASLAVGVLLGLPVVSVSGPSCGFFSCTPTPLTHPNNCCYQSSGGCQVVHYGFCTPSGRDDVNGTLHAALCLNVVNCN